MMDENLPFIKRSRLIGVFVFIGILLCSIPIRIAYLEITSGKEYRLKSSQYSSEKHEVPPTRGSIYDEHNNLLLTSLPVYDLAVDPTVQKEDLILEGLDSLSDLLHNEIPEKYTSSNSFKKIFLQSRADKNRYIPIQKQVSYTTVRKFRKFPVFKAGRYKGGLIVTKKETRINPFGSLAKRTLGYLIGEGKRHVGLEGTYNSQLGGNVGFMRMQKLSGGKFKPIPSRENVEPVDGSDIVTYLDVRMQDLAHNALLKQLEDFEAQSGTLVLMEVKTGAVKAMVNLKRGTDGNYRETLNYAVGAASEPGSTFKLLSYMVALEDGYIDTNDLIETGNGVYTFYGQKMRDSHRGGFGTITVKEAFEKSSNIAIAKIVEKHYRKDPQDFVDKLARLGVNRRIGVDIPGEALPVIKNEGDKGWSMVTLPWMAYGYEIALAPVQILAYYNAIANDGELVKPHLVKEVRKAGRVTQRFHKEVLNSSICSEATVGKLKAMMEGVVSKKGTARNIRSETFTSAGKTGTCQTGYWNGERAYVSSFAGYFPVENPKYSCIVVVERPNTRKGYYGNIVAAPAFKAVRDGLYSEKPLEVEYDSELNYEKLPTNLVIQAEDAEEFMDIQDWNNNYTADLNGLVKVKPTKEGVVLEPVDIEGIDNMPDVVGMSLIDALPLLENRGLEISFKGVGKIKKQSITTGNSIKKGQLVKLLLE
jgi:cell division protein FtsI (penicillin-binding protein 3)